MIRLKEQYSVHELVKTNIALGYMLTDSRGDIIDFNRAAEKITGFAREQVVGTPVSSLFGSFMDENGCFHRSFCWEALQDISESEMILATQGGDRVHIAITSFPVLAPSGNCVGSGHLFRDISRRIRMENERKNLLAMFAHDIKNPASGAALLVERMLSGKVGTLDARQCEYLGIVHDSLKKIVEFTDAFVVYSNLGNQQFALHRERCDLSAAAARVLENLRAEILQKQLKLRTRMEIDSSVHFTADTGMLERVLANIIGNSVKYAVQGGSIAIKLSCIKGCVRCTVADDGIGIPAEAQPAVFDPFYRVPGVQEPGSGLGLAIARGIIEAHGGSICLKSAEGRGTVVSFTIPLLEDSCGAC